MVCSSKRLYYILVSIRGCSFTNTFSLFINDLAAGVKSTDIAVPLRGTLLSILLYADDIVLLTESEKKKTCKQ